MPTAGGSCRRREGSTDVSSRGGRDGREILGILPGMLGADEDVRHEGRPMSEMRSYRPAVLQMHVDGMLPMPVCQEGSEDSEEVLPWR